MTFRTTGFLLLIFVILLGFVYFSETRKQPASQSVADAGMWILTLGKDDVQQLQVTDKDTSVVLARSGDTWYIGAIGGQEADTARINSVIVSLVNLKATRVLTQTEGLAAYGLETPSLTVTLTLPNNKQEVLLFGDKNPQGSQYYVQRRGQSPIYLVYAALASDLQGLINQPPYKPIPTALPELTPAPSTVVPVTPTP